MVGGAPCMIVAVTVRRRHGGSMNGLWKLPIILLLSSAASLTAQVPAQKQLPVNTPPVNTTLAKAFALESQGLPRQAIAAAQSLIDGHTLSRIDEARALDLEGMSYQDIDQPEKAIHALEQAQQLLGPQDAKDRASVLDNLGEVYSGRAEWTAAARLYEQAFAIYAADGDHVGMARVASNQASVALGERKDREGRKYLERADREAKQARELNDTELDDDDLAAIASMHGWLSLNEGDPRTALSAYQDALQRWKRRHGEQHPLTAWGMLLVGQAQAGIGEWDAGARNMRGGLSLMAATLGQKSQRYVVGEMAYAHILEQTGDRVHASLLRQDAQIKLTAFKSQGCQNCTISVLALR